VVKIQFGEKSFLLAGDAEKDSEVEMLRYGDFLDVDVLKVGHHGSMSSSTLSFVQAVDPDYAVISVGKYNRFNLPSKIVIQRLRYQGAKVICTDENGAVVFWTDGKRMERKR